MTYHTVFDAAQAGYAGWWFPAFGLPFICAGALLVFRPGVLLVFRPAAMLRLIRSRFARRARIAFGWFYMISAGLWVVGAFVSTYAQYRMAVNALRSGRYEVAEGTVTDFVPMPYTGHAEESFRVGGRRFFYSDYVVTAGFHHTASHGGPIRAGLGVRVSYLGGMILRLEIADAGLPR